MSTTEFSAISELIITSKSQDVVISNVFITGDAIALWDCNIGSINLDLWDWHRGNNNDSENFIVTGRKLVL
ncbi:hypothetical protein [Niabella hibiscisoli]|uniref:hypothetical protein n=1 Tax=Niabella hibiscisoli TaxID=1825928 RepID=UPI001F0DA7B5|nr:hypothetical protein [Niabella hibiscisoli]MCH5719401.1 hypothetical protein [Niabella hibiscisoli]